MIRINLLPPDERPASKSFKLPRSPVFISLALFMVLALPIAVTAIQQKTTIEGLTEGVAEAKAESARLKPEIDRLHRLQQQTRDLNHRIEVVSELDASSTYYVEVLDDISQILPRHMWLSRIEEDRQRSGIAVIEGYSFTNLQVADLMVRLEKLGHFSGVTLVKIERKDVEGRDVLNFQVEVRLTYRAQKEEERIEHP